MSNLNTRPEEQDSHARVDANIYEDEINLADYIKVIWNMKWFILAATLLPTLVFAISLYLSPRIFKMTYVYDVRDDVYEARDEPQGESNSNVNSNMQDEVNITVFDMFGRLVYEASGDISKTYSFGDQLSSGVYILNVTVADEIKTLKLLKE